MVIESFFKYTSHLKYTSKANGLEVSYREVIIGNDKESYKTSIYRLLHKKNK